MLTKTIERKNMSEPRLKKVQCLSPSGLHQMAYKEWGDPANPRVLLCVHGLTRVSGDFDNLAQAMCDTYRVIAPDVVGRGRSGWLRDPRNYQVGQYVSDMVTLLARADADVVHLFGTSMGGLIGIGLASLPDNPIRKLLLNDIGPTLNPVAVARIGEYVSQAVKFATFDEAVQFIRSVSVTFGQHTDEEWRKFAGDVLKQDADGQWIRHYDLALAVPFKAITPEAAERGEAALWAAYDAISCPTLVVRGAESDLLTRETAQAMTARGPKAALIELPGVGHAPTFMHADQIAIARQFFLS
jgi:pimeloyl-ACP methyl ester carboxylesterase